jgi:single-strand DNA-binding protein
MNRVFLMGRLGRDPEQRFTGEGKSVVNFSLAVDEGYGDKKKTNWINCVAWEKTSEVIIEYVHKGHRLLVEGRLQVRQFTDADGNKRTTYEVVCDRVHLIEKASESAEANAAPPPVRGKVSGGVSEMDDDIPF